MSIVIAVLFATAFTAWTGGDAGPERSSATPSTFETCERTLRARLVPGSLTPVWAVEC
jgi:hypothetical protein